MHPFYKILILALVVYLAELNILPQTDPSFKCKDPKISKKFTGDTVTATNLLIVTYFGPLILIPLIEVLRENSFKKINLGAVKTLYKNYFVGSVFVILITELLKRIVNEARPHFLHTCKPDTNEFCQPGTLISDYICTNLQLSSSSVKDLMRSFPSGHTSLSTFGGFYCAYIAHTRLSKIRGSLTRLFLIAVCVSWSVGCSLSRIVDKKHHWWDVLAGAILGTCSVFYTLRLLNRNKFLDSVAPSLKDSRSKPLKED
ncbi:putative phosphatidate phosphatase isoform X2 [Tribolium madens]|nr:putative phosphatidate phosphatase isoform X2 [Tribolium madens]